MFYVNIWLTVKKEEDIPQVREYLCEIARLSIEEEACLRLDVYHSEADRTRFLLVEHWNSREGWQGHREEIPFTEIYQPKVLPLVDREPHICELIE